MYLKDIFLKYLDFCRLYRKPGTYKAYQKSFKLLLFIFNELGIVHTDQFTKDSFDDLVRYFLTHTNKKNSKINSSCAELMTALRYSNIKVPFKKHKLVDDTTHYKALNDTELDLLIDYLFSLDIAESNNLPWVTAVLLMLDTGARKNEVLHILNSEIDFTLNLIHLETTKNSKRKVMFGNLSKKYITKLYNQNNYFLIHNLIQDKQMTKKSLECFFDKINKNVNLTSGNIHPHRLRKTFATKLYLNGCPLPTIQKLLGHADIKMTMVYLDVDSFTVANHYNDFYPY